MTKDRWKEHDEQYQDKVNADMCRLHPEAAKGHFTLWVAFWAIVSVLAIVFGGAVGYWIATL